MDFSWIFLGVLLIGVSFVQGLGYAVATWFFNKRIEKHLNLIESKLNYKKNIGNSQ